MSLLFKPVRRAVGADPRWRLRLSGLALVLVASVAIVLSLAGVGSASKVVLGASQGSPFCSPGSGADQCEDPQGVAVNVTGNGGVEAGDIYVVDSGNDRIDQFSASGSFIQAWGAGVIASGPGDTNTDETLSVAVEAAGGTFTLAYGGEPTPAIAYDATAAVVEADLDALSTIKGQGGTATVSGGPGGSSPYEVTFGGALQGLEVSLKGNAGGLSMAVGGTLSCEAGPSTATTRTYQWLRNGAPIADATSSTYTTTSADAGKAIQCQVFAIDSNAGTTQASQAVAVVSPFPAVAPPTPPSSIPEPTREGAVLKKGTEGQKLKCESGTWTGAPAFSYQWYRNGVALLGNGADEEKYTVQKADLETAAVFQCAVTATNGGGAATRVSAPLTTATKPSPEAPVAEATMTMTVPVSVASEVKTPATAPFQKCVPANGDTCRKGVASAIAGGISEPPTTASYEHIGEYATGVAVDHTNGNLYVSDQDNDRVDVFSATGGFEGAFGWGVISHSEEKLQFCTAATGCVTGLEGAGAGEFDGLAGIAVDPSTGLSSSGDIYIASNERIDEYHPTLTSGEVTGVSFVHAFGWGVGQKPRNEHCEPGEGEEECQLRRERERSERQKLESCTTTCYQSVSGFEAQNTAGLLENVEGVAVDSTGAIYTLQNKDSTVCSRDACRVQKFNAAGTSVSEFAPSLLDDPSSPGSFMIPGGEFSATSIAVDPADNDVYVAKGYVLPAEPPAEEQREQRVFEFDPEETLLGEGGANAGLPVGTPDGEGARPVLNGLAVGTGGRLYYSSPINNEVYILGPAPAPVVMIAKPTGVTATSATLSGSVDPEGNETHYHFEYSTNGLTWASTAEVLLRGEGTSVEAVHQEVAGLTPGSAYLVRLVASNGTAATSSLETLNTAAAPPRVYQTLASPVVATSADLTAYIAPYNSATTYHFEYGTTTGYGSRAPEFERSVGAGATSVPVVESISGLRPETEYHFRVVASNASGTTYGPDELFTTLNAESPCPNEQVRAESDLNPETGAPFSLGLPECRAYEMVSPPLKNGSPVGSYAGGTGIEAAAAVARVGSEGSTVLVKSQGIWPGGEQPGGDDLLATSAEESVQYRVTRGASGWEFKPEEPAALREFKSSLLPNPADMAAGNGIWAGAGVAPSEAEIKLEGTSNFYLLEGSGALVEVGPSVPLEDQGNGVELGQGQVAAVGGSADLSRMLFNVPDLRWPFDQTKLNLEEHGGGIGTAEKISSLYEYVGAGHSGEGEEGVPTLVGVDNTGTLISQCGTEAGGYETGEPEARSISVGGSTVFFTAMAPESKCVEGTGPAVNEVFARVGEPGPGTAVGSAVTVNVAGSSECATAAFDSCNVTKAVQYQGASTDGSKVFFTSEQPLVEHDTDSTNNLYECRLPGGSGSPLTRMTPVNPCPDLVRVSLPVAGAGAGAEVQSVAAVSENGSHVYFVAKGVLAGANVEAASPTQGEDNLYVWEAVPGSAGGRTAFIATLSAATFALGEAQTTPDGDALVFTSAADLTPDDTSTVAQVFLYEAQHEALTRVSRGQDGYNDDGNTTTDPASLTSGQESASEAQLDEGRRVISENGSVVVFQSSAALTPQVHGGRLNVYLWRDGNVYLISDGTPAGSSVGSGDAGLVGIDASGQNVFFTTEAPLVGQDSDDLSDLYDARVDGGFPAPRVAECIGEACQGALSAPPAPVSLGSLAPTGQGNVSPPAQKPKPPTKPKPLTRPEKLAKALKACKSKPKKQRARCETAAHRRYGAKTKTKHKAKRKSGKSAGGTGR